jgi:RNA polymerase sigma-70 factor (ECF subfamily)
MGMTEAETFERVVRGQKDRLYAYATMMLRDPQEAQDIAQEALVRLWQHRETVPEERAPVWLGRTVHNLCIDRMRRRRARPESGSATLESELHDATPGPLRRTESAELGRLLTDALARMSDVDRAVIVLREVQGLAYAEIAEILDVPLGTLKARLHRAREQLRDRLVRAGVTP